MITHPHRSRVRKAAIAATPETYDHERDYALFRASIQASFNADTSPLFETDAEDLFDTYIGAMTADHQVHNCTACRRFINAFGGLVRVTDTGAPVPAMWCADVPEFYRPVVDALQRKLRGARIVRPFLSRTSVLGMPKTGDWEHFAITNCPVFRHAVLTPNQAAAAKKEDFRTVAAALSDFKPATLDEAIRLLEGDYLDRSERFIAPVKWLRALHDRPKGRAGENLLWKAIATAPDGYCHPRASVVGSLLEDIADGMEFSAVKERFDAKVAPLAYQRPKAAPTDGAIKAAEAMFEKMGLAPALERRFARLDECTTIWKPRARADERAGGVFGHLKAKGANTPSLSVPSVTMTWVKFCSTVLPTADNIDLLVPNHGDFVGLVTAQHPDAPPILKWDSETRRNPVSWYRYARGSAAADWRLIGNTWSTVTGIVPNPAVWGDEPKSWLGDGVFFALQGAVDTKTDQGNALFPECIRAELHGVRSVIEAYSRGAKIGGADQASACGYGFSKQSSPIGLRVICAGKPAEYKIDRWD